jgi:hypothetical protein
MLKVTGVGLAGASKVAYDRSGFLTAGDMAVTTDSSAGLAYGFGGLAEVELPVVSYLGLEGGLLFNRRNVSYTVQIPGYEKSETKLGFNYFQVPLLIRFNLPLISLGAGGYFAKGTGFISRSTQVGSNTPVETRSTFEGANLKSYDYGFAASLAIAWPLAPFTSFVVDGRLLKGLTDIAKSDIDTFKFSDIQVLAGLRVSL